MRLFSTTCLALTAGIAGTAPLHAAVIFDASSDAVYLAADSANVTSTNTSGQVVVANGDTAQQGAYIFGNFSPTELDDIGDAITLSFTISNPPSSLPNFTAILSGVRGGILTAADTGLDEFSRSYAGYAVEQPIGQIDVSYFANQGGPATQPRQDRTLIEQTFQQLGSDQTGFGDDRLESDDTADITLTLERASATEFNLSSTLDIAGSSGVQDLGNITFSPPRINDFQVGDAFTTFGIGARGQNASGSLASGDSFTFTNLIVESNPVPEPASMVLAGLGSVLLLGRRRAK